MTKQIITLLEEAVKQNNHQEQITLFILLGDSFYDDAVHEKYSCWQTIIYAAGLYNYAFSLANEYQFVEVIPSLQSKIYQLKIDYFNFLNIAYPYSYLEDLNHLEERKLKIKTIRETAALDYQNNSNINSIYQTMGHSLDLFYIELFEQAMIIVNASEKVEEIKQQLSIALMCSGANNRMHPYSDIDFLIIRPTSVNDDFITHFVLLVFLWIVELKESCLRSFSVPGLEFMDSYYRYPKSSNGMKFDGLRGGATPLTTKGLCPIEDYAFRGTPQQLVEAFERHIQCDLSGKHFFSIKLISTRKLWGNENLYQEFRKLFSTKLKEPKANGLTFGQEIAIQLFNSDRQKSCFTLRDLYLFKHHLKSFEYTISSLGLYFHLFDLPPEGIIQWLAQNNIINENDKINLLYLFNWLKVIRLEMTIINQSGNLDLPILWNRNILKKYYLKTPALTYFLKDLIGLSSLYIAAHSLLNIDLSCQPRSLHFRVEDPDVLVKLLHYMNKQIKRNNFDSRDLDVHGLYINFPGSYLKQDSVDLFISRVQEQQAKFLEYIFYFNVCIANYHLAQGDDSTACNLLNRLNAVILQFLPKNITQNLQRIEKSSFLIKELAKINANFPTLLAIFHYLKGRCFFYTPQRYDYQDVLFHLKFAKAIRRIIDNTNPSVCLINDQYNEQTLDSLLIDRSGLLRLKLIQCDKNKINKLARIQNKYLQLINSYPDPLNRVECLCIMIRIDAYLLLGSEDSTQKMFFANAAKKRLKELTQFIAPFTTYSFKTKIVNTTAQFYNAINKPQKAIKVLLRNSLFHHKAPQHLQESNEIERLSLIQMHQ